MEAVSELADGGDKKSEESDVEKNGTSDPVVYQLVRVEGDGTLVPATEDEVMQFEHLLRDDKSDLPLIEGIGRVEEFFTNDGFPPKNSDLEGFSQSGNTDIGSQRLDADLKEGRMRLLDESLNLTSKYIYIDDQPPDGLNTAQMSTNILQRDNVSTETTPKSTLLNDSFSAEKEKTDACSRPENEAAATGTSVSGTCGSSMPDFSLLKGEICLDSLTIRVLQETFRATFGRQTTVKDKSWLKRRIAMGLTNSCDVPTSGCVIKDNKIIPKDAKEEIPSRAGITKVEPESSSLLGDHIIDPGNDRDSPSSSYYQSEDQQGSSKRLRRTPMEYDTPKEILLDEQCITKRMRKPTRRYIEELSDIEARESAGRSSFPTKKYGHDQALLKPRATPSCEIGSWNRNFPTRQDTLGGFSVQVPYVSRIRRGRPRRNFMSFLNHHPSTESRAVRTAIGLTLQQNGERRSQIRKARSIFGRVLPLKHDNKKVEEEFIETVGNRQEQLQMEHEKVHIRKENAYINADAHSATKRGGKRKHHRAWTLCEVLKLVDGVARYGAGRWSEIRRLSFASYSYRTSVDLKDKWRNLIRASLAQLPLEKDGGCPRKNTSSLPIPPAILLRVRELAEMHSQTGSDFGMSMKLSGPGRKIVQGKGSGFL